MKERACEAEVHSRHCNGLADSVDHFTPRCIAKLWEWTKKELDDPMNIQHLNKNCHRLKDLPTAAMKRQVVAQMNGHYIGMGEHEG